MYINFEEYPKTGVNEYQTYENLQALDPNNHIEKTINLMRNQAVIDD